MYFLFYVHKAVENKRASEEEIGIELKYLKFFFPRLATLK
jgi:hypothetical protein